MSINQKWISFHIVHKQVTELLEPLFPKVSGPLNSNVDRS